MKGYYKDGDEKMLEEITLQQAVKIVLENCDTVKEREEVELWEARGRVLAENIVADMDQPPFDRSPLDGYAVKGENIKTATKDCPIVLKVIDEVMAGHMSHVTVGEGEAVRIMTGAPIPEGANCVIRQEDTDYGMENVSIYKSVKPFQNYCYKGEDYKAGQTLIFEGSFLGSIEIGTLASLGKTKVHVKRLPRVGVVTTGDEIVLPGKELSEGKIYDSNLYTVATRLMELGIKPICQMEVGDNAEAVADSIKKMAKTADLIITTGGVSVGKKDIMHEVIELLGAKKLFWKVKLKPGSPMISAVYENTVMICLSGNPFGVVANMELLVRPVLAKMVGDESLIPNRVKATLEADFIKSGNVTRYVKAIYKEGKVFFPTNLHSSGILSSMIGCNCLVEVPPSNIPIQKGQEVWVVLL
ncbi:MAG: gephyrin-like molybdotransferase Glp [Lachnospiraceae bacterium]